MSIAGARARLVPLSESRLVLILCATFL